MNLSFAISAILLLKEYLKCQGSYFCRVFYKKGFPLRFPLLLCCTIQHYTTSHVITLKYQQPWYVVCERFIEYCKSFHSNETVFNSCKYLDSLEQSLLFLQ